MYVISQVVSSSLDWLDEWYRCMHLSSIMSVSCITIGIETKQSLLHTLIVHVFTPVRCYCFLVVGDILDTVENHIASLEILFVRRPATCTSNSRLYLRKPLAISFLYIELSLYRDCLVVRHSVTKLQRQY